jgi:DNA-binding transcriptional LysR family regulator
VAGVSQPTIHRAARDLEGLSGISLFEKTSKGIELTPAAEALAQAVKLAFAELEQGITEIEELHGIDSGTITIGAMPLLRTFVLPTAVNTLLEKHPGVKVSIVDGPYNDLLHGLRHGEIDLLVGALRDPVPIEDVVQEQMFSNPLSIVGRVGHPLNGRSTIQLDDLAAFSWAVPRHGTPTRDVFERLFETAKRPSCIVESSSLIFIRGLMLESDWLTLISAHQIRLEQQMGLLAPLAFDMTNTSRPIGITTRREWRPTATQRDFLDQLRSASKLVNGD